MQPQAGTDLGASLTSARKSNGEIILSSPLLIACEPLRLRGMVSGSSGLAVAVWGGNLAACQAWWYRHYDPHGNELKELEKEARSAERGLWQDPNPVPPWEWRRIHRDDRKSPR